MLITTRIFILGIISTSFVSPVGDIYSLYLILAKGNEGDNNFGIPDNSKGILQIFGVKQDCASEWLIWLKEILTIKMIFVKKNLTFY